MRVRMIDACDTTHGPEPAGYEVDHPDAYRLCELGVAEPLDDEAKAAVASWQERQKVIAARQAKLFEAQRALEEQKQATEQEKRTADFERLLREGEGPTE